MDEIFSLLAAGAKFKRKSNNEQFTSNGEKSASKWKTPKAKIDLLDILDETSGDQGCKAGPVYGEDDNDYDEGLPQKGAAEREQKNRFSTVEEVNAFRNRLQIKVSGDKVPQPAATFREMGIQPDLKPIILHNVEESDWKEPTPIQMQAIPVLLSGRDLLASAPTGSGKTAAFVVPVLSKLGSPKKGGIRALLLAPTKELAEQIHREASRLCTGRRIKIHLLRKPTAAAAANMKVKTTH
jgi:ATP-dependent RNA helicase DDX52/ROK1